MTREQRLEAALREIVDDAERLRLKARVALHEVRVEDMLRPAPAVEETDEPRIGVRGEFVDGDVLP